MAETITIPGEARQSAGTGAAHATRREGRVPGIIYGKEIEPVMISIDPQDLRQQLAKTGFFSRVFAVTVSGETHRVLARDVQFDPVTDRAIHVDFMRFSSDTKLNIEVEMVFENEEECPGIKRGGVLNVVRRTIELICPADHIPQFLTADLTGLDIGDSVQISAVSLPEGVAPVVTDRDFTIATIASPTLMPVDEEEEEEGEDIEGEEGEEGEEKAEGEAGEEGEEKADKDPEN
jgi:large subunit ribosomal protein L25